MSIGRVDGSEKSAEVVGMQMRVGRNVVGKVRVYNGPAICRQDNDAL